MGYYTKAFWKKQVFFVGRTDVSLRLDFLMREKYNMLR